MITILKQAQLFLINQNTIYQFAKWSRPQPKPLHLKTKVRGRAQSDEKSAKISQAEQEEQQKKAQEELKRKQELELQRQRQPDQKSWDEYWEENVDPIELHKLKASKFPAYYSPSQIPKRLQYAQQPPPVQEIRTIDDPQETVRRLKNKVPIKAWDVSDVINEEFYKKLQSISYENDPFAKPVRAGAIGIKVGMTAVWDKWGYRHALTVVQLDRNQVIQVKTLAKDGVDALQIGSGEANMKTLTKPLIGHFLKHNIPPKQYIREFPITPENALPVGFMINVRHFTPGQLIDIKSRSVGKGFAGTIKRWNFNRQPASHGNSLSHRMLGSTGNRADPGRVFKGKKMPGRLGGEKKTVECLIVYKIDANRQLLYLKGSIPGKAGSAVYIRDSIKKAYKNEDLINYPTFIAKDPKHLARLLTLQPSDEDPESKEIHENDVIEGEEED